MRSDEPIDVAIVGAGIGGSGLAVVLAKAGLKVLLLEKTKEHKDVVRGEWLAPWGVEEANYLGLTDLYMRAGANRIDRHISYSEFSTGEDVEDSTMVMADTVAEKPLCLGHPKTCDLLNEEAVGLGVEFQRGVRALKVTPGEPPRLHYQHDGQMHELSPRWIVGADGRKGVVARQMGCSVSQDAEHHLFSGMLVKDAHAWPCDLQVVATEGDVNILAFPQGDGVVRIYLGWPSSDRGRLVGPDGPARFLDSWRINCVPQAEVIASATPISPCIAYPNQDAWVDSPVRPGVVLIGDAAGRNDPIIGQGLSVAHRDVHFVSDAMLHESNWRMDMFEPYVAERAERMQRLRTVARLTSLRTSVFGDEGFRLRLKIHERMAARPDLAAPFAAGFLGPQNLPAEIFSPVFTEEIVGAPIWEEHP